MPKTCSGEKSKYIGAQRDVERIRREHLELLAEAEKYIRIMKKGGAPRAAIGLARELMRCHSFDEVNDFNAEAAEYWMPPNNIGEMSTIFLLARRRTAAIDRYHLARIYLTKTKKALDDCLKKLSSRRCGRPKTGWEVKGEPCQQRLGPDGRCQYHG